MYVANEASDSITEYAAGSIGTPTPIAVIAGDNSGLSEPSGIALDEAGNIYVTSTQENQARIGSVTVYANGSYGNVAPMSISGPDTKLDFPSRRRPR